MLNRVKTKRISQLVKQIAPNIDDLLNRYSQADIFNAVNINKVSSQHQSNATPTTESSVDMIIRRIERLEQGHIVPTSN